MGGFRVLSLPADPRRRSSCVQPRTANEGLPQPSPPCPFSPRLDRFGIRRQPRFRPRSTECNSGAAAAVSASSRWAGGSVAVAGSGAGLFAGLAGGGAARLAPARPGDVSVRAGTNTIFPIPTEFPPLRDPEPPNYRKVVLSNGLRVFLLEDDELGLVRGQLSLRGGSRLEPATKVGLAGIAAAVQRSGGTIEHPNEQLDDILESLAASVESSSGTTEWNVGFQCLASDTATVLPLFSQVILQPAMPDEKVELVRTQTLGGILRRNDDAGRVAGRKTREILYGKASPYARVPQASDVSRITRQDVVDFHRQSFCDPSAAVLGIWGAFDSDAMLSLVEQHLGASVWASAGNSSAAAASAEAATTGRAVEAAGAADVAAVSEGATEEAAKVAEAAQDAAEATASTAVMASAETTSSVTEAAGADASATAPAAALAPSPEFPRGRASFISSSNSSNGSSSSSADAGGSNNSASSGGMCFASRASTGLVELEPGIAAMPYGLYLVDRPGLTQGYVRMGELGTTLDDDDVFALDVLNSILNGFGGRLFDQVRSKQGLAYSVSGGFGPAIEHRGAFVAGGETQLSSVPEFILAVLRVLENMQAQPPTDDELKRAKDGTLNSFVFNFANTGTQLSRILSYELYGIRDDFLFEYKRRVEETTTDDVLRVARKHLHPREQRILIVGDAKSLRRPLERLGVQIYSMALD